MAFLRSLILFVLLLPLLELFLLFYVGGRMGAPRVFLLLAVSFFLGWVAYQRSRPLSIGRVAGVLLMVPGFITDVLALLLMLPGVRQLLFSSLLKNSPWKIYGNVTGFKKRSYRNNSRPAPGAEGEQKGFEVPKEGIKDAEFRILPEEDSRDGS